MRVGEGRERAAGTREKEVGNEEGGGRRGGIRGRGGDGGGGARRKAAAELLSDDVLTSSDAIDVESVRASEKTRQKIKLDPRPRGKNAPASVHTICSLDSLSLSLCWSELIVSYTKDPSRIASFKKDSIIPSIYVHS